MELSDKNIREILASSEVDYQNDILLENSIMDCIDEIKIPVFNKTKIRVRIGIWACLITMVLLIVSLAYNVTFQKSLSEEGIEKYMTSAIAFFSMAILFVLKEFQRVMSRSFS